jgi:NADPH-dependent glutamate synthase beta subunit-like oxidoreductase/NAD-dependent dihydropyrimidine dehydrogenase PreA subunit
MLRKPFELLYGSRRDMLETYKDPLSFGAGRKAGWEIFPLARKGMLDNLTGYWREMRPYREERLSPCRAACPAGEDIPVYTALALARQYEAAFFKIAEENPLAAICGRVCYHPCEDSCLRSELDAPVSIHRIERFVGDYGLKHLSFPAPKRSAQGSVAVVGSGPAGLSAAYHARRLGHSVTIFEAYPALGGMLRQGIPAYRLPRSVLEKNVHMILALGMEVRAPFRLGSQDSWKELDTFDAVFLALGAQKPILPSIEGIDLPQVVGGLDFLKEVNSGVRTSVGKRVAVVGGGNTAIDAARVSRRLGAEAVILYRRSRRDMPAHDEEIDFALNEGIRLLERVVPVKIDLSPDGSLKVACRTTEPRGRDASGRTRYEPVEASEVSVEADLLIMAAGQEVEVPEYIGSLPLNSDGVTVGKHLRIGESKYFAGGDAVPGTRRVCDAVGAGKLAALSMHAYLEGLDMDEIWPRVRLGQQEAFSMHEFMFGSKSPNPRLHEPVDRSEINLDQFKESPRPSIPIKSSEEAVQGFDEVVGDVFEKELQDAALRCFSCGTCTSCDVCYNYCPDLSVKKGGQAYEFDYDFCKGCAICAEECPRGVIHMKAEEP